MISPLLCVPLLLPAPPTPQDAPTPAAERALQAEVVVAAPRAEVWRALTTTEGVTSFFAPHARVELRHGGPFEVWFLPDAEYGSRGSEGCTITSYVPEEMLAFTWNVPPSFAPELRVRRSFVVITLTDEPAATRAGDSERSGSDVNPGSGGAAAEPAARTRVRLVNGGYGTDEGAERVRAYFERAWPAVLSNLRQRFETGPLFPADARRTAEPPPWKHYVYYLHPTRPELLTEGPLPAEREPLQGHVRYVRELVASGRAILAGPSYGPTIYPDVEGSVPLEMRPPGIVIFRATDDADAQRVLEGDPAVRAGVFQGCANPFTLTFREP